MKVVNNDEDVLRINLATHQRLSFRGHQTGHLRTNHCFYSICAISSDENSCESVVEKHIEQLNIYLGHNKTPKWVSFIAQSAIYSCLFWFGLSDTLKVPMAGKRDQTKKRKFDIYDKYREILDMPDLTDKQIDQMRKHVGLFVQAICEHVWKKKFY